VALLCGARTVSAALPPGPPPFPWGRALGRERLDTLLLSRAIALGVSVWQPFSAQRLSMADGLIHCELRDERPLPARTSRPSGTVSVQAPLLIAAHGSWQPLPGERAEQPGRRPDRLLAFKANFADAQLAAGVLPVLSFAGGYGGMVLADGGVATLACCIRAATLQACRQGMGAARAGDVVEAYLKAQCRGVEQALRGATRIGEWLAVGPLQPGTRLDVPLAPAAAREPALAGFRIGNAAGEAHPLIGEGISMAIQSAWLLCEELLAHPRVRQPDAAAAALRALLQRRYAARWQRQFRTRLRLAACFAHVAMQPRLARGLLPLLRGCPALLTRSARWCGKVRGASASVTIAMPAAARQPLSGHTSTVR